MGRNHQEPVSEDLNEAAINHSKASTDGNVVDDWIVEDFKAGAKWQKQQTIKKACEWLDKNTVKYIITKPVHETKMTGLDVSMVDDFKEAMEG